MQVFSHFLSKFIIEFALLEFFGNPRLPSFLIFMQASPLEFRTGIGLASGSYIRMTDNRFDRILLLQQGKESQQRAVLTSIKVIIITTLKLDTYRKVITLLNAFPG